MRMRQTEGYALKWKMELMYTIEAGDDAEDSSDTAEGCGYSR